MSGGGPERGWYLTGDGADRYWDGQRFLSTRPGLPGSPAFPDRALEVQQLGELEPPPAPARRTKRPAPVYGWVGQLGGIAITLGVIVVAASIILGVVLIQHKNTTCVAGNDDPYGIAPVCTSVYPYRVAGPPLIASGALNGIVLILVGGIATRVDRKN